MCMIICLRLLMEQGGVDLMVGKTRSNPCIKCIAFVIAIAFFCISGCSNNSAPAFSELTFRLAPNESASF